jgi:hypothetical protein
MAAVTLTGTHKVMGELENGLKMVITDITTDAGTDAGTLTITPLKVIDHWIFSVKDPGTVATTMTAATVSGRTLTVNPAGDPSGSLLTLVSFGR